MRHDRRFLLRVALEFPIDPIALAYLKHPALVRLDLRVKRVHPVPPGNGSANGNHTFSVPSAQLSPASSFGHAASLSWGTALDTPV